MLLAAMAAGVALGAWHPAPPLQRARAAHALVSTGQSLYVLGGSGGQTEVERYDGQRWSVATTLPHGGLNAPAAVALDSRIYVIGGFSQQTNLPTDRVEIYDPATDTWSDGPPLPAPRGGHAAVLLNGTIHVLGGGNDRTTLSDHTVFDPATQEWTAAAPLPRSEGSVAVVAFHGELFAIGGRSGPSDFGDIYIYDPNADSWRRGPSIPPRATGGAVVFRGAILYFGGESQRTRSVLADVLRLEPGAKKWTRIAQLPTPRNYARAIVFRNAVYVVGGSRTAGDSHGAAGSRVVERYTAK
jgi:N-acetylneuraminic acid mutarotase